MAAVTRALPDWARPAGWDDPVDLSSPTAVGRQVYGGDLDGIQLGDGLLFVRLGAALGLRLGVAGNQGQRQCDRSAQQVGLDVFHVVILD